LLPVLLRPPGQRFKVPAGWCGSFSTGLGRLEHFVMMFGWKQQLEIVYGLNTDTYCLCPRKFSKQQLKTIHHLDLVLANNPQVDQMA
jgi:hypothetical protein